MAPPNQQTPEKSFIERIDDLTKIPIVGSGKQEIENALTSITEMSLLDAAKKYNISSNLDPIKQRSEYILDLRQRVLQHPKASIAYGEQINSGQQFYISKLIARGVEQYKQTTLGKAETDAIADFAKKQPEIAKDLATQLFLIMKHGAETQQDIYGKALAKYQDDYEKKMVDIIDRGVNAIISPHEARVEMANLGIKFGMIMSGLGAIFGKDEWVETGSALAAQGESLATKEGEKILTLTKTLRDEYVKLGKDWQAPDFTNGLDRLPMNYSGAGQEVFNGWREGSGFSALQKTIRQMNDLSGGKLLEDPVIRQHSFGGNGDDQPSGNNPKSVRLNNPGNIRDPKTGEFIHYPTKELGLAAMRDDLLIKIRGDSAAMERVHGRGYKPTIENIISVWAPPSENNTNAYIEKVARESGIDRKQVLQPTDVERIMLPMIHMEGGLKAYNNYAPLLEAKATVKPEFNQNAPRIAGGGTGRSPDIDVVFLEEQKPGSKPADKGSFEHIAKIDPLKLTLEM